MQSIPQKACTTCGTTFPATPEYFSRHSGTRDGLDTRCKACRKPYHAARYQQKRDQIIAQQREYYERDLEKSRANARKRVHAYQSANPEKVRESARKSREKRRDKNAAYTREYCKNHRDRYRAHGHARRTRLLNAPGSHTEQDIQRQYEAQQGRCYWCQKTVGTKYHVDHVIPLVRGGNNNPENLVISCPFCNNSRKDRLPEEWTQRPRMEPSKR